MNQIIRTVVAAAVGVGIIGFAGCRSMPAKHGERGITATYTGMTLTADLPDPARTPAVMAAAEETFRARGYAILRSDTTADSGELVAVPPRSKDYPRMVVRASNVGGGYG